MSLPFEKAMCTRPLWLISRAGGFSMWVRARRPMLWPGFGKGSDERSSTSSIPPPISLPLSSPLYMKTARTPCMIFDHFHVVKLMNEKLDEIRRAQYNMEKDINKRRALKGRVTTCCAMEWIYSTGNRGQGLTMPWI